jgi:hypothetical protein
MVPVTWAEAKWAIAFYEKHGFAVVSEALKDSSGGKT